eukprot:TRINITY_DN2503_c1_g1_i1.p1 TRINITY_DN2503_c1_g1~~TRINITY_DN2503_c1_g1_i1.p1  ORF type:complete len:948 (+),score=180.62 TRINITY_DN2503_c1_g1_i1:94-2844(+)
MFKRLIALSARADDTPLDTQRKQIAIPVLFCCAWLSALSFALMTVAGADWDVGVIGIGVLAVMLAVGFLLFLFSSIKPEILGTGGLLGSLVFILCLDLSNAMYLYPRNWNLVVLLLDMCLVLALPNWTQFTLAGCTLLYLAVERTEAVMDFGLYHLGALGDRKSTPLCDCDPAPCTVPIMHAFNGYLGFAVVFITDFILTRGFAMGLRRQQAIMEASIRVAEQVAVLLAAYSVADAERLVDADGDMLPPALQGAMRLLLSNLKSYRPYLPDSLLNPESAGADPLRSDTDHEARAVVPPGLGELSPFVSLCFTDIESSTALWEAHPQGMYDSLLLHNSVMRSSATRCGGYEVKTIGDAFMLAFGSASGACRFALDAQSSLLSQQWPDDLLQHPLCRPQTLTESGVSTLLWNGLRVRIGINCGQVRVQCNPVTGRCDYFGGTVNVAARVEAAVGAGGLIGVTDAVLEELGTEGLELLGAPALFHMGSRELKGVKEPVKLHAMLPAPIARRFEFNSRTGRTLLLEASINAGDTPVSQIHRPPMLSPDSREHTTTHSICVSPRNRHASMPEPPLPSAVAGDAASAGFADGGSRRQSGGTPDSRSLAPRHSVAQHGAMQQVHSALALQLRRVDATCTTVRAPLPAMVAAAEHPGACGAHLSMLEAAADSTQGTVTTVLSSVVVVTWNASRHCPEHSKCCIFFLKSIQRISRAMPRYCGVASGEVFTGNLAAGRRRFASVIGPCLELSAALAEEALLCGDNVLATGPVAESGTAEGIAHWAQVWKEKDSTTPFVVWQLSFEPASASTGQGQRWGSILFSGDDADVALGQGRPSHIPTGDFRRVAELHGPAQFDAARSLGERGGAYASGLLLRAQSGALRLRVIPNLISDAREEGLLHHIESVSDSAVADMPADTLDIPSETI